MNEKQVLDKACSEIEACVRQRIDRNDTYSHADMLEDIRNAVSMAMQYARLEQSKGN